MLEQQIADLVVYAEGAVGYSEAWSLSAQSRERLVKSINRKNKEAAGDKTEMM